MAATFEDLPDEMVLAVMSRCTARSLTCLASTCRRARRLALEVPMPRVVLTGKQMPAVMRWLWSPDIAPRLRVLVARRCLYGECKWLAQLPALRCLVLTFCRIRIDVFSHLAPSLEQLEVHQVLPSYPGETYGRIECCGLKRLRQLHLVFAPGKWDAVFLCRLPKCLTQLHMRGANAVVVESSMPSALRDASLHAASMLFLSNRLPSGVERVSLSCDEGRLWMRDTLPRNPRRLRWLSITCTGAAAVPELQRMTRLEQLTMRCSTFMVNWRHLGALRRLRDLELRAKEWLGLADSRWPADRPFPARLVVSVRDIAVDLPGLLRRLHSPADEARREDGDGLRPDA